MEKSDTGKMEVKKSHPVVKAPGRVERFLSSERVRASVVDITALCEEVRLMQGTSPSSTIALSRLLVATTLLASHTKEGQEVAVQISCKGPLKSLFAHCTYGGHLRGALAGKKTTPQLKNGEFSLSPLMGPGFLTVTTYVPKAKEPRKSQVQLVSGEIGPDITHYLQASMQIHSLISLGVQVTSKGEVRGAGGVLIELMPGHKSEVVDKIEQAHKMSSPLSELIAEKKPFSELLVNHSGDVLFSSLGSTEIRYLCSCKRKKAAGSIELLGLEELNQVVQSQESLNIDCDMCGMKYEIEPSEIRLIRDKLKSQSVH